MLCRLLHCTLKIPQSGKLPNLSRAGDEWRTDRGCGYPLRGSDVRDRDPNEETWEPGEQQEKRKEAIREAFKICRERADPPPPPPPPYKIATISLPTSSFKDAQGLACTIGSASRRHPRPLETAMKFSVVAARRVPAGRGYGPSQLLWVETCSWVHTKQSTLKGSKTITIKSFERGLTHDQPPRPSQESGWGCLS